ESNWISRYSVLGMTAAIPDSEFETLPAAHALIHRCTVGGHSGLMLAPTGVLPQHHGEGAGTAVISAALNLAEQDGEAFVMVYGYPHNYPRFEFMPDSESGISAEWASEQPEALQVRILDDQVALPTGEVKLPEAYGVQPGPASYVVPGEWSNVRMGWPRRMTKNYSTTSSVTSNGSEIMSYFSIMSAPFCSASTSNCVS